MRLWRAALHVLAKDLRIELRTGLAELITRLPGLRLTIPASEIALPVRRERKMPAA